MMSDDSPFVRAALEPIVLDAVRNQALNDAITTALLAATGPAEGVFHVTVRMIPGGAEVEVLHAKAGRPLATAPRVAEEPFADWLTAVLRGQGLSQRAAAQRIGVSVRTVSRWLTGVTEPRLRDLRRVHALFGAPSAD